MHENVRVWHDELPELEGGQFHGHMLLESTSKVFVLKGTMVGKFSNGMEKIIFSLFYRFFLKILPTSYSFLPFLTIFGPFGLI